MKFFKNKILIIVILLIAAYVRLYKIEQYMTFLGDEGRDAITIFNILHGKLTLLGPTASVGGFFMGPAYYYLVTPFFWLFNYSPVGASVMVAFLSVVTVWLIYKIGAEFFSEKAGLIAAFFYALSPLVITYSHSSWNPNVMPFFTLVTLYSLYKGIQQKNMLFLLLCGFLFGIDIQLHYVELFIGPVIMLYVIFMHIYVLQTVFSWQLVQRVLKDGFAIFVGFLLGFSPFLAFEFRHEFLNSQSILQFIFQSGETGTSGNYFITVWDVTLRFFGRLLFNFPLPQNFDMYNPTVLFYWYLVVVATVIMCFIYLFFKWKASYKEKNKFQQLSLIALWLMIGLLFFGFYKRSIYDYYFEFMFPIPFLLWGAVLSDAFDNQLFQRTNKKVSLVVKSIVIVIIIGMTSLFYSFSPLHASPNLQMQKTQDIADFVLSKTDGKPFNFALITGGNSDHGYKYFFIRAGREPVVIQNPQVDPERDTVTDQLLVVCDSLPCSPLGHSLWEIAGFGRAEVVGHWKVSYVEVYKLVPYKEK